ncbi:MAG: dephospho-CoA kinase [Polaromonas sp.]|uniref:dephospho-CoA kinase n=1 Tax=Polaromonas sp. TaxID=1869339 RepID=UPI002487C185|nr:dephospho-CoA kinase [Polaromonas sp.]MDI1237918.1 dephospho-CoA kinase [Polaromonas sp.]MDI1338320.1 dephospho-CoA kinase [Polaromonas sp.]
MRALRLGLTGGIGSGKSTVATMLADCGAAVIDSDAISRQLTAPGGAAMDRISEQFGARFITPEGGLNRDAMREHVFADAKAKKQLEAIIHPLVGEETARQAGQANSACIVFDVPLLVESGRWRQRVDQVLVVDCSEATQVSRVMARNGWTREAVERVLAGQANRDQRLAAADICIYNDAPLSLAALAVMVQQLSQRFGL